jgi:hypothetical protein
MNLALLQSHLLQLIMGQPAPSSEDSYLKEVESCEGLESIREISRSWNEFSLDRLCPLTCRLLRQRGELTAALAALAAAELSSAFVEDLAAVFLEQQVRSRSAVVGDVARFETAMLSLGLGLTTSETVEWQHHPDELLGALVAGRPVADLPPGRYKTVVSFELPMLYRLCDPDDVAAATLPGDQ